MSSGYRNLDNNNHENQENNNLEEIKIINHNNNFNDDNDQPGVEEYSESDESEDYNDSSQLEEYETGAIILQPIYRDPVEEKKPSLFNSQDMIKPSDKIFTKVKKTLGKTNKFIKHSIIESNQIIGDGIKESNKKIEDTFLNGLEQVAGVGIKAVDAVEHFNKERIEKIEKKEKIIWNEDKKMISKYECLDYVTIYNKLYRKEMYKKFEKIGSSHEWQRWIISFLMGVFIGLFAFIASFSTKTISKYKFIVVGFFLDDDPGVLKWEIWVAFAIYFIINAGLALTGSLLAVYFEPTAAGSGIPEVKGYLNGTRIPHVLKLKTLFTKLISMIFAVSSNLQVGAEGPMIHIGAIVGNGFSQAQSKEIGCKIPILRSFRNDKDKRDFVTTGAGAGVAAAFSAPLGGCLFSLEEVSSFWNSSLTWRAFFTCLIASSTFTLASKKIGRLPGSTIIFDMAEDSLPTNLNEYISTLQIVIFLLIGVIGGLTGALFTLINVKVVALRRKYINKIKSRRVLEVFIIIGVSTLIQFFVPFLFSCKPYDGLITAIGKQQLNNTISSLEDHLCSFTCIEGSYNPMASLIFSTNENAIDNLLSINGKSQFNTERIGIAALIVYFIFYFLFAAYTAGCGISSGTFIPMLIIGAAYGRIVGIIVHFIFGGSIDPGIFALMGAAAFMAGVSRLTISLSVILIETTNQLQYLLPLMLTVMVAKWVADLFIHPLFDLLIQMKYIPYLEPQPHKVMKLLMCKHIMAKKPIFLCEKDTLGNILAALKTNHNGFPIVTNATDKSVKGLILRSQLLMILEGLSDVYIYNSEQVYSHENYTTKLAWKLPELKNLSFDPEDYSMQVDFSGIMNLTVFTVNEDFAVSEAFNMFRTMGLRHMPVVNCINKLKGIITKKDLLEMNCEQKYRDLRAGVEVLYPEDND